MNIINRLCAVHGISSVGVCEFSLLSQKMTEKNIQKATELVPNASSVYTALFPYYASDEKGNISLYARGKDYHIVISDTLSRFCNEVFAQMGVKFAVLVDNSPLPEVMAASLSGVGKRGENGLIFDKNYGSFVFIGTILTDIPYKPIPALHEDGTHTIPPYADNIDCIGCGKCRSVCPLRAIENDGKIKTEKCISELTQRNGELTAVQQEALEKHELIWGCDICQTICPQNKNTKRSENELFTNNLIKNLSLHDVNGLTRKQFNQKFPERAFTWRGTKPIVRNLLWKEK